MSVVLTARGLDLSYGKRRVFAALDLQIEAGTFVALIGPNGAGKSSLLRLLAGVQRPSAGQVTARECAVLIGGAGRPPADVTPRELAGYGLGLRRRWWEFFARPSERETIEAALARVALLERADDPVVSLSDGEIQRAWLASGLALSPGALLIDEPTTHLDLRFQLDMMRVLRDIADAGVAVVVAIHDLSLAGRFADTVALLADGRLLAGPVSEVLEPRALSRAFGVRITTHHDPQEGHIVCVAG